MADGRLPEDYPRRATRRAVLIPVLGLIALGTCGLVLIGLGTAHIGALPLGVGTAAALVPVVIVVAAFLWVDRWEPEPPKLLVLAFVWGACGAAAAAKAINDTAETAANHILGIGHGDWVSALISAPLFEEAAKGLFLLGLLLFRQQEYDGVVDGVVYGGIVAAGFAFTENIYYFALAFTYGGVNQPHGVIIAFVSRGIFSPFVHPLFTVMTGIGLGIAARTTNRRLRVIAPVLGYLAAVALHSLWDGSALLGGPSGFLHVYFLGMVPLFAGMILLVLWQRRHEQRIVADHVPAMAEHGWIAGAEQDLLTSMAGRRRWRAAARRQYGFRAARKVAAYQAAVTELAFLRHGMDTGVAGDDCQRRHERLVAEVVAARNAAVQAEHR